MQKQEPHVVSTEMNSAQPTLWFLSSCFTHRCISYDLGAVPDDSISTSDESKNLAMAMKKKGMQLVSVQETMAD